MALLAGAVIGGAALAAGTGVYASNQAGKAAAQGNANNAQSIADNRRINQANALQDALNSLSNARQLALENQRYDEAKAIEDKQRQLTNSLAMATQVDSLGNKVEFDPATGTWRASATGVAAVNRDRGITLGARSYDQQLEQSTVGADQARDRRNQGARIQGTQRALSEELMARYAANQGRTPGQMQSALVEKNVAEAMDPLTTGGNMAMLQGYRQGNSGNDALMGSLARQSQGGTRSAIANARFAAPGESLNERDMAAKAYLSPATSLAASGTAGPGVSTAPFAGDVSNNLLASLSRNAPAGVGTTLSPRGATQLGVKQAAGNMGTFTPANASGNAAAGISESLQSLLNNKYVRGYLNGGGASKNTGQPAYTGLGTDSGFEQEY